MFAARFLLAAVAITAVASQANPLSDVSAFVAIINSSNSTCASRPACAGLATATPPCYGFVNNITQQAQCICTPAGALAFESCARCVAEDPCPNVGNAPLLIVPQFVNDCIPFVNGSVLAGFQSVSAGLVTSVTTTGVCSPTSTVATATLTTSPVTTTSPPTTSTGTTVPSSSSVAVTTRPTTTSTVASTSVASTSGPAVTSRSTVVTGASTSSRSTSSSSSSTGTGINAGTGTSTVSGTGVAGGIGTSLGGTGAGPLPTLASSSSRVAVGGLAVVMGLVLALF